MKNKYKPPISGRYRSIDKAKECLKNAETIKRKRIYK